MKLNLRQDLEQREDRLLAPYACRSAQSRGRKVEEKRDWLRTEFQRDRDRIIHCQAFRKLEYKTQVYVTHEGDYFRTRLTHTMEVAQVARTMATALGLNADLTEAIALAHDLGHTPFGHAGEHVLNKLLETDGGYEHNAQSLRVVEVLEQRFHDRPGLNLTWEVRAGIASHATAYDVPGENEYVEAGKAPTLESQLVDLADQVAYNSHDIDDALSMGLLTEEQLREVPWVWDIWSEARGRLPELSRAAYGRYRALGKLLDSMVEDVLKTSGNAIEASGVDSVEAVINHGKLLVAFSKEMEQRQEELRAFLMASVYRHPITMRMTHKAATFFGRLFELYQEHPELLPIEDQRRIPAWGLTRVLIDYMSGMTDRYCIEEYMTHFEPTLR